jgi:putative ABC transport system permease protein
MIGSALWMALRALARNRLRSSLTMLGVVIGVAAVIALVTIGKSATEHIAGEIAGLGDNLVWVQPGDSNRLPAPPLRISDATAIKREINSVREAAPSGTSSERLVFGNANWASRVWGVTSAFFDVRRYDVVAGRSLSAAEIDAGAPVCVIGPTVRRELFGGAQALDQNIRIRRMSCRVVGILGSKGSSDVVSDEDDIVLMPLAAYHRRLSGDRNIDVIFVSARPGRSSAVVAHQIGSLMRELRRIAPGEKDNFRIRTLDEVNDKLRTVTGVLTALLGAIAAVSLLVGGIGIMNIMLVSVTERTREIGIRLAIGARSHEVLLQFLVEAIVLSTLGGIVGMCLGLAGSYAATRALDVKLLILPEIVAVAFFFSALVGVAFGFLPARRAARLHPIEALRHE